MLDAGRASDHRPHSCNAVLDEGRTTLRESCECNAISIYGYCYIMHLNASSLREEAGASIKKKKPAKAGVM